MTRTFIALELNNALQRHLAGVIRQMAQALPSVRWVDPASIHLTLAFLGELDDRELEAAKDATRIAAGQCKSFEYGLSRLNIFGPVHQPRVIWISQYPLTDRGNEKDQTPHPTSLDVGNSNAMRPNKSSHAEAGPLQHVHQVLNAELLRRGFEVETRPFVPHFTLSRPKAPLSVEEQGRLRSFLVGKHDGIATDERFRAEELVVMRSELLAGRSRYSVVEGFSMPQR